MYRNLKVGSILSLCLLLTLLLGGCGANNAEVATPQDNQDTASGEQPSEPEPTSGTGDSDAGGTESFENKVLEVAVFQGAYGRAFWDALAESFMEDYPGTEVHITASPEIGNIIRPQVVAGNPPDVIYSNATSDSGVTQGLIDERALVDLTDVFEGPALDDDVPLKEKMLPGILESSYMQPYGDGHIYAAPYNYNVMGLWYNHTLFEEHDITPPRTWAQFFALNDKAKALDRALYTYPGVYPYYNTSVSYGVVHALGGDEALERFTHYDPEFWREEGLELLKIFEKIGTTENMLMHGTLALNHTQAQTEFMKGNAMFLPTGSWLEAEMEDAPREEGFEFGFLGVPTFEEGDAMKAQVGIEQIFIPAEASNPELAKEFVRYIYTEKGVTLNAQHARGVLAVDGAVELARTHITPSSYNVYKAVEEGIYAISANFAPVPDGINTDPSEIYFNQISSMMNGDTTAEAWADKMYEVYSKVNEAQD